MSCFASMKVFSSICFHSFILSWINNELHTMKVYIRRMQACSVAQLRVVNRDHGNSFHEETESGNGEMSDNN